MSSPFVGEIRLFGGTFAPAGWAFCNGQLLSIANNEVLFTLIGTTYGGDGVNTFGLPDLRGRVPIHQGSGAGLTPRQLGQSGGTEDVTLLPNQLPAHTHSLSTTDSGQANAPTGALFATVVSSQAGARAFSTAAPTTTLPAAVNAAGGSQSHNNMQPSVAISYIIAINGVYPSQN